MALARRLGSWWWIPGAAVFTAIAAVLVFVGPYLDTGLEQPDDPALVRRATTDYERAEGLHGIPLRVEEVSGDTSQANAYAFGIGPSSAGRALGHAARRPLHRRARWTSSSPTSSGTTRATTSRRRSAGSRSSRLPGALVLMLATRRRGGMGDPRPVPLALLVAAGWSSSSTPAQNVVSRRTEAEADWKAVQTTRDPQAARGLFREFAMTSLGEPQPADLGVPAARDPPDARAACRDGGRLVGPAGSFGGCRLDPVAITDAIASDDVTPGDGALRTWTTPGASWNTKSSMRAPSERAPAR